MGKPIRIGALISGTGSNLTAVIHACEKGQINGRVVFAGADNPLANGLIKVEKLNIPTFVVDYADIIKRFSANRHSPDQPMPPDDFDLEDISRKQGIIEHPDTQKRDIFLKTRCIAEAQLLEKMAPYPFDLLILAGFMRNLTPYFIDRVNTSAGCPRIMNIHPSLLPGFPGTDGYGDTFRYGCKVGGCTVHFIDYGEDTGPIIGQRCFTIDDNDTISSIKKKGLKNEWMLYPECIAMFAENRLKIVKATHTLPNGKIYTRSIVKVINQE